MWKNIDSATKDQIVLLGIESYDCGWIFDTGVFNDGKWVIPHVEGLHFNHMPYTHWFENPDKLAWKSIYLVPKDKVVLLGKKNMLGKLVSICSAWWCKDLGAWVSTGGLGELLPIKEDFNYFSMPPELDLNRN